MKNLTDEEFLNWAKNTDTPKSLSIDDVFVLVSGKTCPKCKKLKEDLATIRHPEISEYVFTGKNKEVASILKENEVSEVPVFLVKYIGRYKMFYKTLIHKWTPPKEIIDAECIFDAISQNDHRFFGYDEYGQQIDRKAEIPENDQVFDVLIRTIKGDQEQSDPKMMKEFIDSIDHIGTLEIKDDIVEENLKGDKHAAA